jgi:hypothetical protein
VAVAVLKNSTSFDDFTVAKRDGSGNQQWLRTIDGDGVVSHVDDKGELLPVAGTSALATCAIGQSRLSRASMTYGVP